MNIDKNAKLTPLGRERMVNLTAAGRDDVGGSVSLPNQGWEYLHVCINDAPA